MKDSTSISFLPFQGVIISFTFLMFLLLLFLDCHLQFYDVGLHDIGQTIPFVLNILLMTGV